MPASLYLSVRRSPEVNSSSSFLSFFLAMGCPSKMSRRSAGESESCWFRRYLMPPFLLVCVLPVARILPRIS